MPAAEPFIRLAAFAGVLMLMLALEQLVPRRPALPGRAMKRLNNLALVAVDTLLLRLAFPLLAVGAAALAQARGIGLFNLLPLPVWLTIPVSLLLLDLAIWGQHRLFHALPWLWRLHRVHHSDPEPDTTTALRFHPLEIMLSMLIKLAVVLALGVPPLAVLLFELLLNAMAMFNHANIRLPPSLEAALRAIIITPDLHRIHHSVHGDEMNGNFGFNLSLWDRCFGTLRKEPRDGQTAMQLGLADFRGARAQAIDQLLLQPWR